MRNMSSIGYFVATAVGDGDNITPWVIVVCSKQSVVLTANLNHITLQVLEQVVLLGSGSVTVRDSVNTITLVIVEQDVLVSAPLLGDKSVTFVVIVVAITSATAECTESVTVVLVHYCLVVYYSAVKLALVIPYEPIRLVSVIIGRRQSRYGITVGDTVPFTETSRSRQPDLSDNGSL